MFNFSRSLETLKRYSCSGTHCFSVRSRVCSLSSQNQRTVQTGWGWKTPLEVILFNPLLKQGHLELAAQDYV